MPTTNYSGYSTNAPFSREVELFDQERYFAGDANALILAGRDVANTAAYMKFGVKKPTQLCDHPIENGAVITDHKIVQQRELSLTVALPELGGGKMIEELESYLTSGQKIIVKCATGVYWNMLLIDAPTNITPNNLSRPMYDLSFREVLIVTPEIDRAATNAANQITVVPKPANESDRNTERTTAYASDVSEKNYDLFEKKARFVFG